MFAAVESDSGRSKKKGIGFGGWLSVFWLVFLIVVAIAGIVTNQKIPGLPDPKNDVADFKLDLFSSGHLLGTDSSGQDILSLTANGTSASLEIGFFSVLIGFAVGGLFGILSGYFKGRVGAVLGASTDILLAFPPLVLAISIVTFLGHSVTNVTMALAIVSIPVLARISRASTLSWAEREFVTAARAQGAKHGRVMIRELLPNVLPAMLSIALLGVAVVIVAEAGLAIVGAGVSSDVITWGSIINSGRQDIQTAPQIVLVPSFVIFLTVMALNYLGDALRAKFDVRESAL
jgi:peptide/nickel transport system permease protein